MRPRSARLLLAALLLGIYSTLSVARTVTNAIRDAGLLRASVGTAFALASAAVLALLLRNPALRRPRALVLLLAQAVVYALVVWPMESPEEKLHFLEYGAVAVLAFLALPPRWSNARRLAGAALFTLAAGWLDEGIQALLPNRYYDLRDVGFNALAGLMALTCFGLLRWLAQGKAPAKTQT
jgi:VanZ family protein